MQIYTVLDKTMIGFLTGDAFENGYYEQASKIPKMLLTVLTALGTVLGPRIGKLFEDKNWEEIRNNMYMAYRFVWFLGFPMALGLSMIAGHFIPCFLGEGYEPAILLTRVLAFLILVIGFSGITGMQYMVPIKQEKWFTLSVTIGAGVNFLLNLILIPGLRSLGATIASIVAECFITGLQFWLVRKQLDVRKIILSGGRYLLAGAVMGVALYFLSGMWPVDVLHTALLVLAGAFSYGIMLIIERDPFLFRLIGSFTKKSGKEI